MLPHSAVLRFAFVRHQIEQDPGSQELQIFLQRHFLRMDARSVLQAHIAEVPRLVAIARDILPALIVAEDEAEAPGVFAAPLTALCASETGLDRKSVV